MYRFHVRAPTYYQRARDLEWYLAQLESESGAAGSRQQARPSSRAGTSASPAEHHSGPPAEAPSSNAAHQHSRSDLVATQSSSTASPCPVAAPSSPGFSTENDAATSDVAGRAPMTLTDALGVTGTTSSASPTSASRILTSSTTAVSSATPTQRTASPDDNFVSSAEQQRVCQARRKTIILFRVSIYLLYNTLIRVRKI